MDNTLFNVNTAMNDINSHFIGHDDMDDDVDEIHHHPHLHHKDADKAKMAFKRYSNVPPGYTAAVARRNERERNRVRQVNNGFVVLRQKIPFAKSNKKMSKVETLRCAVDYIRQLQQLLNAEQSANQNSAAEFSSATSAFSSSTMSPNMYASPTTSPVTYSSPTTSPLSPHSLDTSNDALPGAHFYQQDWFNF